MTEKNVYKVLVIKLSFSAYIQEDLIVEKSLLIA